MEKPIAIEGSLTGNTTRLIDYYIQELFKGEPVYFEEYVRSIPAYNNLLARIEERLWAEHRVKLTKHKDNFYSIDIKSL